MAPPRLGILATLMPSAATGTPPTKRRPFLQCPPSHSQRRSRTPAGLEFLYYSPVRHFHGGASTVSICASVLGGESVVLCRFANFYTAARATSENHTAGEPKLSSIVKRVFEQFFAPCRSPATVVWSPYGDVRVPLHNIHVRLAG